ncbi:MAG: helicase-associated domain-containing protein [Cyanosarcina radialis HA8281-LM2]|jgi:hypothetical protein|nr:helicase-associated domain-containing protein [Cyanosarcina radialis HA8281-LM2]
MPYFQTPETVATIAEGLNQQSVDRLKKLLPHLPTKEKPTRKAEIIELIERYLQGRELKALWEKLDSLQQAAVAEAVHSPNTRFDAARFQAKYGELPDWGTSDRYGISQTPSRLVLFFCGSIMPEELKQRLKAFVPPPVEAKLSTSEEIPQTIEQRWREFDYEARKVYYRVEEVPLDRRLREQTASQELLAMLRLIDAGKVSVSEQTRLPSAATLKAITDILVGGDYYTDISQKPNPPQYTEIGSIAAFGWSMLLQAGGLAELSGKKLRLTKAGQKALSDPTEKTLKHLWQKWLKTKLLDEFRRINEIKGQTGKGQRSMTAVVGRREAIYKALHDLRVDRWVTVDEFFRYMQAGSNNFEVTRDPWSLYICEAGYGSLGYQGFHEWSMLQGRYVLCLLFEYAATLGIVDVAYISPVGAREDYRNNWGVDDLEFLSRYDGLMYIRLTPLGAYCLDLSATYTPKPIEICPVLRVLPNREIAAIGEPLSAADILALDMYAEKVSDAVWRLEMAKLLKVAAEGRSIEELAEFLQARSSEPLPQTIEQFLADVRSRSGSLKTIGTGRIIECADAGIATLIAHDSRTKKYCFLASESRLIVPLESETKFRNALQKLGYSLPNL